jgi:hypothetical protein
MPAQHGRRGLEHLVGQGGQLPGQGRGLVVAAVEHQHFGVAHEEEQVGRKLRVEAA